MFISFNPLTKENAAEIFARLGENLGAAADEVNEILEEIIENLSDGCEYAVSSHSGCILLRIFDGEYVFPYPIAMTDEANPMLAADEIRRYTVKEEIPLVICDLPREALSEIIPLFRHVSIDAADLEGDYYTVRVLSELSLTEEISSESMENVELSLLIPEDEAEYARLCRDGEGNRYWGYDFSADAPDCEDSYFLEMAERELDRGVAISLAIRYNGIFVGEAILYYFDLKGGAQCALRILPEYRRKGIASNAISILEKIASQMGLIFLYATVDSDNEASCNLFNKSFDDFSMDGRNNVYVKYL